MSTTYKNPWYYSLKGQCIEGLAPEYSTDSTPVEYRGYLIYERIKGVCFDIVEDGVCVGQYAGVNGARRFIDGLCLHGSPQYRQTLKELFGDDTEPEDVATITCFREDITPGGAA